MKNQILEQSIKVFGKLGFKKATMMDLAKAAGLSKQGLYLYFPSKEALFVEAATHYLDLGLKLVDRALANRDICLEKRLLNAVDAWFGRHYETFHGGTWDVIFTANNISVKDVDHFKHAFQQQLADAINEGLPAHAYGSCSSKEIANTIFVCGLSWKEQYTSKEVFLNQMFRCIKVCCRTPGEKK